MTTTHPPRCTISSPPPSRWRVTLALPDGGPITLPLLAATAAEAAINAMELAGAGSRIRRVQRQGEW